MAHAFKHLILVLKHKHKVFINCCKCGLFWRGIVHDMSKFSPTEFFESAKYYAGKHSPITNARIDKGYSKAWLHHKGRNKHHIEYWYDSQNCEQADMPYKYAVENICDRIAAAKTYHKLDYMPKYVLAYWQRTVEPQYYNTRMYNFYLTVFTDLAEKGEKYILNKKYLKTTYFNLVTKEKQAPKKDEIKEENKIEIQTDL